MNEYFMSNNSSARTTNIAFLSFVGLGLSSGLLGVAWPSIQKQFELPLDAVNLLFIVSTITYTLASLLIGRIVARLSSGITFLLGAILLAGAMFSFAVAPAWGWIVLITCFTGFGGGLVDAGLNLYIATYHTARQMNWLHASFGVGITFGPLIMKFVLDHDLGWQKGYAITGVALCVVVVLFALTRREWRTEGLLTHDNKPVSRSSFAETLRNSATWFSMLTYLCYVGVEIGIGQWTYTLMTESRGVPIGVASTWVAVYWGVFTGGRIFFGIIANRFQITNLLRVCMLGMITGVALFWWNGLPNIGFLGLIVVGFSQAPVFPLLMSSTANRVGVEHAENTIGLQMGAVGIGGAVLPGLIGTLGAHFGLETMATGFLVTSLLVFTFHELAQNRRSQTVAIPNEG
jgi:fucose permease